MTAITAFTKFVAPDVPGAPNSLIERAVLRACIEFCEETKYWRYRDEGLVIVSGIKEYDLSPDTDSQVETVNDPITVNGKKIYQRTKTWLDQNLNNWETLTGKDPKYFQVESKGLIRLVPFPDADGAMSASMILKPIPTATTVPDFLFDDYYNAIADGARFFLMEPPGKEWTNTELSIYYGNKFQQAKDKAEAKARADFKTEDTINRVKAHLI